MPPNREEGEKSVMGMTREEALEILNKYKIESEEDYYVKRAEALNIAIKALEQEPFINKPCIASRVCEHDKNKVLNNISAEIKALSPEPTAYDVIDGNPIKDAVWETLYDVLQIIDKYREGEE